MSRSRHNFPSPRGAKEAIVTVILHSYTMASTEGDDSPTNSNHDFFRLRGLKYFGSGIHSHGLLAMG